MIRILWRSLLERPRRTALFLVGYALGVAVVTALLAVGEAVLHEARDKDLLGGGDVIVLPVGIDLEALQVGGSTALYYKIPGLRFLVRTALRSPRVQSFLGAASPRFVGEPLYLESRGRVTPVTAVATVPSRERQVLPGWAWPDSFRDSEAERRLLDPSSEEVLAEMDHFHAPPAPEAAARARWAEWQYFEIFDPATGRFAYLSFQALGDWPHGGGAGLVSIQLSGADGGAPVERRLALVPPDQVHPSLERPDLTLGTGAGSGATVREIGGLFRVRFRAAGASGEVEFDPDPAQRFSTGEIHGDSGLVSGYAVPFLRARARGWIRDAGGGAPWIFDHAVGYHDHNWGTWKDVVWNWGKVSGDSVSLLYGQIQAGGRREPGFAALFSPRGLLALFRPESVSVIGEGGHVGTAAGGVRLPQVVRLRAGSATGDSLWVDVRVDGGVATPVPAGGRQSPGSILGSERAFLQLRGYYHLKAVLDGRQFQLDGPGPLETYAPLRRGM